MSTNSTAAERSLLNRFCDSFLHERNIKWVLGVGMLILLGSSVLLVSAHWATYTPVWKYLIFLTYTAAIFAVGQWTRHRLALVRTGTVLQILTLLLVPVTFLVLHWVQRDVNGQLNVAVYWALLGLNLGFAVLAARRIFHHFLRGHQHTFLGSYLMLALLIFVFMMGGKDE